MNQTRDTTYHVPVLADEVVRLLGNARSVLDGTLGGGGHSQLLLERGVALVVGVDRDPEAVAAARERLQAFERSGRFRAYGANYADVGAIDELRDERFEGVLLDLGVSSHQLDAADRGFTFREGAPLDMRMGDRGASVDRVDSDATAADILNTRDVRSLTDVFREYADEPRASRLAREIVRRRATQPFATSDDLVRAIRGALGPRTGPSDFARLFQALRIEVNDELDGLRRALPGLRDMLLPGGIIAVITYHSGEDRLVKNAFREWSLECICPPKQLQCTCRGRALGETLTRRPISAPADETKSNPRARSAKLRAWRLDPGNEEKTDGR